MCRICGISPEGTVFGDVYKQNMKHGDKNYGKKSKPN